MAVWSGNKKFRKKFQSRGRASGIIPIFKFYLPKDAAPKMNFFYFFYFLSRDLEIKIYTTWAWYLVHAVLSSLNLQCGRLSLSFSWRLKLTGSAMSLKSNSHGKISLNIWMWRKRASFQIMLISIGSCAYILKKYYHYD